MKKHEIELIAELLKDSRQSDRAIGKTLGVSQPTVSRTRAKLERDRVILQYSFIPDLTRLGFELLAITTSSVRVLGDKKMQEKAIAYLKDAPNVLYAARAQGMGKDAIIISVHKDFTDYENFAVKLKRDWINVIENIESILVSLKGFTIKHFSLEDLGKILSPPK